MNFVIMKILHITKQMQNKSYTLTQEESIEVLSKIASKEVVQELKELFKEGKRVQAIKMLRKYKVIK